MNTIPRIIPKITDIKHLEKLHKNFVELHDLKVGSPVLILEQLKSEVDIIGVSESISKGVGKITKIKQINTWSFILQSYTGTTTFFNIQPLIPVTNPIKGKEYFFDMEGYVGGANLENKGFVTGFYQETTEEGYVLADVDRDCAYYYKFEEGNIFKLIDFDPSFDLSFIEVDTFTTVSIDNLGFKDKDSEWWEDFIIDDVIRKNVMVDSGLIMHKGTAHNPPPEGRDYPYYEGEYIYIFPKEEDFFNHINNNAANIKWFDENGEFIDNVHSTYSEKRGTTVKVIEVNSYFITTDYERCGGLVKGTFRLATVSEIKEFYNEPE